MTKRTQLKEKKFNVQCPYGHFSRTIITDIPAKYYVTMCPHCGSLNKINFLGAHNEPTTDGASHGEDVPRMHDST